jgi:hypothetical protein
MESAGHVMNGCYPAPMVSTSADGETAVRNYLLFLTDPDSLVNAVAVARLEDEVAAAGDPVDRLMAMAKLHKAKTTDPDTYEAAFIAHGKAWADDAGVPASAFEEMGVPVHVLESAGFFGRLTRKVGRGIRRAAPVTAPIARRPAIRSDDLEAGILGLEGPFSVKDVSAKIGGSAVTVKAAVDRLEAQGRIVTAGERAGARGRASKVWTVAEGSR